MSQCDICAYRNSEFCKAEFIGGDCHNFELDTEDLLWAIYGMELIGGCAE